MPVTAQVSVAGGAILTFGTAIFWATAAEAEAVHPFAGSVTVTEYVAGEETAKAEAVPPPFQL